ncbi:hypothetical protein TS64_29045 [Aneurinibacillus migulanus]|nr:hypothetical protein TS64_29045 [Aneurinibacillus migulanus]
MDQDKKGGYVKTHMKRIFLSLLLSSLFLSACTNEQIPATKSLKKIENLTIKMNGASLHWSIEGYTCTMTKDKIEFGNGTIRYIGADPLPDNQEFVFFELGFYTGKGDTIQRNSATGVNLSFPNGMRKIGSIKSSPDPYSSIQAEDVKNSYAIVKWSDKDGKEQQEKIELKPEEKQ